MKVLLLSSDSVDVQMAGPGIRYWEFARHLSQRHEVTLLTPNRSSLTHPAFRIIQRTKNSLNSALQQADIVVTQGMLMPLSPLIFCQKPLVIDLYDPLPVELLEHHSHLPLHEAQLSQSHCIDRMKLLLRRGDFFLYSHERQRDYWLGLLTAVGRVNHRTYRKAPTYSRLFACVPYGIPDEEPQPTQAVLKGKDLLFDEKDTVILWGGGLWKWFDPCSVIRAMYAISAERQDIKLLFMGAKRAASDSSGINIAYATEEAIALSKELGLHRRSIFFHEDWIPYEQRQNYLLEADIGISTHFESLETRLSFRTRILDYLWTELPIITTEGDFLSECVQQHRLGLTVLPGNVAQLQNSILRLADDRQFRTQCRENIRNIRQHYLWQHLIRPLENFCASPYRGCDLSRLSLRRHLTHFHLNTAKLILQHRGYKKVWAKISQKMQL